MLKIWPWTIFKPVWKHCQCSVRRLLMKAQDWLALMAGVSRQRVPLKRMREVLHAGQRLGVDIPEVENLRLDIRRREWEDAAKKVPAFPSRDHSLPVHIKAEMPRYSHRI